MNVRAKFDGGKQIQSGSWQARCPGAALRINEGSNWGSAMWFPLLVKHLWKLVNVIIKNSLKIVSEH